MVFCLDLSFDLLLLCEIVDSNMYKGSIYMVFEYMVERRKLVSSVHIVTVGRLWIPYLFRYEIIFSCRHQK